MSKNTSDIKLANDIFEKHALKKKIYYNALQSNKHQNRKRGKETAADIESGHRIVTEACPSKLD